MEARDIILPAAALTVAVTAAAAPASAYDAKLNHPETWGSNCRKIDMPGNVMTYNVNDTNVRQVIVKGGTTNKVYTTAPFTNLTSEINPNSGKPYAISHIIICGGDGHGQTAPADDVKPAKPAEPTKPAPAKPAEPTKPEVLGDKTENKGKGDKKDGKGQAKPDKKDGKGQTKPDKKADEVKTSSASTNNGRGVAVQSATTDQPTVAELPQTGAGTAGAAILAAGAATYAGARALRKR